VRQTSSACSGAARALEAVGTLSPSNIELNLKAILCFFDSSYKGASLYRSSAVIVSRISYRVCRSLSPGKSGIPLSISANMHPQAQISIDEV
jgi:hypothetical protein